MTQPNWKFSLPDGTVETITLPNRGDADYATKLESVTGQIERIYPYMGFRPGLLVPRSGALGDGLAPPDTVAEPFVCVGTAASSGAGTNLFTISLAADPLPEDSPSVHVTAHKPSLQSVRWGHHDVVPVGYISPSVFTNTGPSSNRTVSSFYPVSSFKRAAYNDDWVLQWDSAALELSALNFGSESGIFGSVAMYGVVLWWPPEEYIALITEADIYNEAPTGGGT